MTTRIPTAAEIDELGDREYKVLKNRIRRAAARQGRRLEKSRARDPRAIGYGTYHLADEATNTITVSGSASGFGLSLSEVARSLHADVGAG